MADSHGKVLAVKAASLNMLLQVLFRAGTFLMNAVLLRYISRELLGIANVRLSLLYTTILFISREAIRKACLNKTDDFTSTKQKQMVNLIWIGFSVGIFSSTALCTIWIYFLEQPSELFSKQYGISSLLFAISALIELSVEPLWIFGQKNLFVTAKVVLEGFLILIRSSVCIAMVVLLPQLGLYSFSFAYVLSSSCYSVSYYFYFWWLVSHSKSRNLNFSNIKEFFPNPKISPVFDPQLTSLVTSFYKQSILKQFLTEGERYLMTIFHLLTWSEQGLYDVINNLGALAARFIFMPIEESYYVFFSGIVSRGTQPEEQSSDVMQTCSDTLSVVLKFVSLTSFTVVVFGYSYSFLLLDIYGGDILSNGEGPLLLRVYCLYVVFLAVNGITECFMFASMSKHQVDSYNYKMLGFSMLFLLASLAFTKFFGAVGFILANCLNMLLRIIQSSLYILNYFHHTIHRPLWSIGPSSAVFLALFMSFVVTGLSEKYFCCDMGLLFVFAHVLVGVVCLLMVLLCIYFTEHNLVNFMLKIIRKRKYV